MKRNISWTARGELIHEGAPVAGSNVVDIVNDLLRKRKTDPTGWQPFARQLRSMNLPMEFVGNVARRDYIRQATTTSTTSTPGRRRMPATPRSGGSARRSLSWTPLARRRGQMEHSMLTPPPERQRKAMASLASWETFKTVRHVSIAQCVLQCRAIHRTRTVPSSLRYYAVYFT